MTKTIGLRNDLNIETCVGIMTDMKHSQDWFYSFRWVPARFFGNRIRTGSQELEHKLTYRAHKALSPCCVLDEGACARNRHLSPRQYRDYYHRIMKAESYEELQQIIDGMKF